MNREILGREFDWFALDCNGDIAVFISAGSGVVPDEVARNYKAFDDATEGVRSAFIAGTYPIAIRPENDPAGPEKNQLFSAGAQCIWSSLEELTIDKLRSLGWEVG